MPGALIPVALPRRYPSSCRSVFGFGDVCPSCDVQLVSSSFIDSVPPERSDRGSDWRGRGLVAPFVVLQVAAFVTYASMI